MFSNVLPLHHKQTFPPMIWIFTEGWWDRIQATFQTIFFFVSASNQSRFERRPIRKLYKVYHEIWLISMRKKEGKWFLKPSSVGSASCWHHKLGHTKGQEISKANCLIDTFWFFFWPLMMYLFPTTNNCDFICNFTVVKILTLVFCKWHCVLLTLFLSK